MMVAPGEVEGAICRLAQLARAAGASSDPRHTETVRQCHYRTDQGEYAFQDRLFGIIGSGFPDDH